MNIKVSKTVVSSDKVDSKFDYKKFLVNGKQKDGKQVSGEIFENQGHYLIKKNNVFYKTLEDAFQAL